MDNWGWERKKSVKVNAILLTLLTLPCIFGFNIWSDIQPLGAGSTIMDLEDFVISNNLLPIGSLVFALFCCHRYGWGWDKFIAETDTGEGIKFPKGLRFYLSYILPAVLIIIFLQGYIQKFF
jgi:NSS family neurotransmitter:Na+ symporter